MFIFKYDKFSEKCICQVCFEFSLQSLCTYQKIIFISCEKELLWIPWWKIQFNVNSYNNLILREEKQLTLNACP